MSALLSFAAPSDAVTMTSLELVEFINSQREESESELRHDNFMAKVPKVLGKAAPKFLGTAFYVNGTGARVERQVYTLPKREACLMAMSYSYELQAKVFDRMTALEKKPSDPMAFLADPAAMRGLLLTYTEKVLDLENTVAAQTPKVEALDRISDADGLMNPTGAAKALQVQPKRVFDYLRTNGWIYRRAGARSDTAYQDKIAAGLLTHKVHVARREDGSEKICEQVMVTPKGLTRLAQDMAVH